MIATKIQNLLDISSPSAFVATYSYLLDKQKPNRNRALIRTTQRIIHEYLAQKKRLEIALTSKVTSCFGWIKRRRFISKMKAEIDSLEKRLNSWVSATLATFKKAVV